MAKPPASPVFNQTCTASGKPPRVTLTGAWYYVADIDTVELVTAGSGVPTGGE
jgi:hypothetical protein